MKHLLIIIFFILIPSKPDTFAQIKKNELTVDLRGLHLSKIPDSIYSNKSIVHLNLGSKNVIFFPPLSASTDMNSNEITFISESISNLTNLKSLILNTNKLTYLPNSITKLKNLEVLDLSLNKDLKIILEIKKIKQLPKLKVLKIVDVKMTRDELDIILKNLSSEINIIYTIEDYLNNDN